MTKVFYDLVPDWDDVTGDALADTIYDAVCSAGFDAIRNVALFRQDDDITSVFSTMLARLGVTL